MADELDILRSVDPELEQLKGNKQDGYNYRERRQEDWLENYTLSRDKVTVNRLTQRQSVNLPLMKTVIRTLLKDVDDMPVLQFQNLDNDKEAEVFKNEYWKYTGEENKFEILDIVDKRQVFYFGRSFDQWQVMDGKIKMSVVDPEDILISRYTDPTNIHSSRFLVHTHIFVPLVSLRENNQYDQDSVNDLEQWYATQDGLLKQSDNQQMLIEKNRRMGTLGVDDIDQPSLGETIVEISMHFVWKKEEDDTEEQIYLYVEADDYTILMKKRLEEVIGKTEDHFWRTHYPYNTWADDVEMQDFWSDAVADIVRTANKVLNAWYSQEVENRTLNNLNMKYYNSNLEGFVPQTWEPRAFGSYGIPVPQGGKIDDVIKDIEVKPLNGNLETMNFLIGIVEKATGATATSQGAQTERQITLGEVQLALGEAKERIRGMSKFYNQVWKERGLMFTKLIEAAHNKLDAVRIYKKGRNTDNIYSREISPKDWMTASGYVCKVWSQDEKRTQDTQSLEKMNALKMNMPDNPKVDEIFKRKLAEFAELSPEETNDIMAFEEQKRIQMLSMMGVIGPGGMLQEDPLVMQQLQQGKPGGGAPAQATPQANMPLLPSQGGAPK
jgi:hypothetical protein